MPTHDSTPGARPASPLPFRFEVHRRDDPDGLAPARPGPARGDALVLDGTDPATGRRFLVEVTDATDYVPPLGVVTPAGPADTDALLAAVLDPDGPWQLATFEAAYGGRLHYRAWEWRPVPRVLSAGPRAHGRRAGADVPDAVWNAARERPSAVYAAVRALAAAEDMEILAGNWGWGAGPPLYRESLAGCVRAIARALGADVWLQSEHPERTARLAPHPDTWKITFVGERALAASPHAERFREGLAALAAVAPADIIAQVTLEADRLRVRLVDPHQHYPNSDRVRTTFDPATGAWGHADLWYADAAREPFAPVLDRLVGAPVHRAPDEDVGDVRSIDYDL